MVIMVHAFLGASSGVNDASCLWSHPFTTERFKCEREGFKNIKLIYLTKQTNVF